MLTDNRIVVDKQSGRLGRELEGDSGRDVIQQVANKIDRTSKYGLGRVSPVRGVDSTVVHDANIVHATVSLHKIIIEHVKIIVIDIN